MKVLVGLSGGVDSAVAAYLLKQSGHDVVGATMSIWEKGHAFSGLTTADACFSPHEEQDIDAAREICKILDIPYHTLDCSEIYKKTVLENFKSEYLSGRTPNPCVWCNAKIKFKALPLNRPASTSINSQPATTPASPSTKNQTASGCAADSTPKKTSPISFTV